MSEKNEKLNEFWGKTKDLGKKVANDTKKGAEKLYQSVKENVHNYRVNKYKPLFMKEFRSKSFNLPNIIKIVDDAVRRNIDVCEGAIGWTETRNNIEILFLYDEAVGNSGIEFVPHVGCDQLYYVDHFNRNRFIQANCIFERAHSEKIAELEHIAYSLGAKSCHIEIVEADNESIHNTRSNERRIESQNLLVIDKDKMDRKNEFESDKKQKMNNESTAKRSGITETCFEGNNAPTKPNLKWFANDDSIKGLIEMRCSGNNNVLSRTLKLEGATSATMSQSIASTIDLLLNERVGIKKSQVTKSNKTTRSQSMETKAIKESSRTLIFEVKF